MSIPGDWQDEAYWKLQQENRRLRACLRECAESLEGYIEHDYEYRKDYPSQLAKYERDMAPVKEARRLLGADEQKASRADNLRAMGINVEEVGVEQSAENHEQERAEALDSIGWYGPPGSVKARS